MAGVSASARSGRPGCGPSRRCSRRRSRSEPACRVGRLRFQAVQLSVPFSWPEAVRTTCADRRPSRTCGGGLCAARDQEAEVVAGDRRTRATRSCPGWRRRSRWRRRTCRRSARPGGRLRRGTGRCRRSRRSPSRRRRWRTRSRRARSPAGGVPSPAAGSCGVRAAADEEVHVVARVSVNSGEVSVPCELSKSVEAVGQSAARVAGDGLLARQGAACAGPEPNAVPVAVHAP